MGGDSIMAQGVGAQKSGSKKATIKRLDEDEGRCFCPCELEGSSCRLTFKYTNINQVQDDGFDFYIIKPDGSERFIGNIDAACKGGGGSGDCSCANVDVFSFDTTINQDDLATCEPCSIQWRSELVKDNGCGTFGLFEIIGPYGSVENAGEIGGAGTIYLRKVCIDPEANG
jgi:hypothetical protein